MPYPTKLQLSQTLIERLADRIDKTDSCWLWTGCLYDGYGYINITGHSTRVHIAVYEFFNGPVPAGHDVHHKCEVKKCINPEHLEVVEHGKHRTLHAKFSTSIEAIKADKPHMSLRTLAKKYGISKTHIQRLVRK